MSNIDFVITWVDDGDPQWQAKRAKYDSKNKTVMNDKIRYRDYGTLKYWFRAVEKFAPWVHKVYFVVDNQIPAWLNLNNEKLEVVNHKDFIDEEFLPTFNSNAIELNITKIKGLSEKFVLFNDDMYLNDFIDEKIFFKNDLPVGTGTFQPTMPTTEFTHIVINNLLIINKWFNYRKILGNNWKKYFSPKYGIRRLLSAATTLPFNKIIGFYDEHLPIPYLKSTYDIVLKKASDEVYKTSLSKIRNSNNISHWLVQYYNFCTGAYYPRKKGFGRFYELQEYQRFVEDIKNSESKVVCINDSSNEKTERGIDELNKVLEEKFPIKSLFEK